MQIDYPYHYDNNGRTATTPEDGHIRDMIEQVLFTSPGERVNRPDFGCGILQLVFEPNSDIIATTTQMIVHSALQQWLSDLILVEDVTVESVESTLSITVRYMVRRTQMHTTSSFRRGGE